jgi:hypothetical protein
MTLHIETLLFSATSILFYTNRFWLSLLSLEDWKKHMMKKNKTILLEIKNLNLRLTLIRYMQLLACAVCSFLVFCFTVSVSFFWLISLPLDYLFEISISVNALRLHLSGLMDDNLKLSVLYSSFVSIKL